MDFENATHKFIPEFNNQRSNLKLNIYPTFKYYNVGHAIIVQISAYYKLNLTKCFKDNSKNFQWSVTFL